MSRTLWRCRNRDCPAPHWAVLGRVTSEGGLVLDPTVEAYTVYIDTRRAVVRCPACREEREFRGRAVHSPPAAKRRRFDEPHKFDT